ncbi:MAG: hypothetical protein ABFC92_08805, partial [Rectinema sp.]
SICPSNDPEYSSAAPVWRRRPPLAAIAAVSPRAVRYRAPAVTVESPSIEATASKRLQGEGKRARRAAGRPLDAGMSDA